MKKKVLITAALPYVNNLPHFGHIVGCHLPADIFYRYQKAIGNDAIFIGGADEHGTANLISAQEFNLPPEVFVKKVGDVHREIYKKLGISYSLNSGTHTPEHEKITQEFFTEIYKNGYIEERETEMLYCEKDKIALADRFVIGTCPYCGFEKAYGDQCDKCGAVYDSDKLINPHCKFCGEPVVFKKTKHLFLKLDKIEPELDKWIEEHKNIWRPHVYGEAKRWIKEGLTPRAITRDIPWLPVRAVLLLIHKIDKVNVIAAHHFQQAIRRGGHHHSLDQRKLAVKFGNQVGDHRSAQRFHRPDAQRSLRFRRRADNIFRAFRRLHHLPGLLQKSLSRRGKADRAADPFKQRDAQLGFQLADLYRDGGLGVAQLLRGMGKILQFRHPQKSRNVTQLHLCSPLMHFRHSITNIYGMVNKN